MQIFDSLGSRHEANFDFEEAIKDARVFYFQH